MYRKGEAGLFSPPKDIDTRQTTVPNRPVGCSCNLQLTITITSFFPLWQSSSEVLSCDAQEDGAHPDITVRQYPFVTVTSLRQAGKTTLCRSAFPALPYANLETHDQREFAHNDPRGFLGQFDNGTVIDEIQRVPELLSYLQVLGDEQGTNGQFVLTGSGNFALSTAINQLLAGRTAVLHLRRDPVFRVLSAYPGSGSGPNPGLG